MTMPSLFQELIDFRRDPLPSCAAGPTGDNMFLWQATIMGPVSHISDWIVTHLCNVYEIGRTRLMRAVFSPLISASPPIIHSRLPKSALPLRYTTPTLTKMVQSVWISLTNGRLRWQSQTVGNWSHWSTVTIIKPCGSVLLSIRLILTYPSLDYAYVLEPDVDHIYQTDRARYEATAREWTTK